MATLIWFVFLMAAINLTYLIPSVGLLATLAVLWLGLFWSSVVNG